MTQAFRLQLQRLSVADVRLRYAEPMPLEPMLPSEF